MSDYLNDRFWVKTRPGRWHLADRDPGPPIAYVLRCSQTRIAYDRLDEIERKLWFDVPTRDVCNHAPCARASDNRG